MAKKCQINRDNKRRKLIAKYATRRAELRKRLNDPEVSIEEKLQIQEAFAKMPRNSCPTRLNRRCDLPMPGHSSYYPLVRLAWLQNESATIPRLCRDRAQR